MVQATIDMVASELARSHFEIEPGIERIIWLPDGADGEIRLIEISPNTLPFGEVYAVPFAPTPEFPCRTLVADVTPDEWGRIERGEIELPGSWSLRRYQVFSRN